MRALLLLLAAATLPALAAVSADVTYHHIEMWLDAANSRPVKAKFYTESGQLLKTAYYL